MMANTALTDLISLIGFIAWTTRLTAQAQKPEQLYGFYSEAERFPARS
jgi:hypothetical protein